MEVYRNAKCGFLSVERRFGARWCGIICAPALPRRSPLPLFVSYHPSRRVAVVCLALSMSLVGSYVALSKPLVAAIPAGIGVRFERTGTLPRTRIA